jgi:hypothetical protein
MRSPRGCHGPYVSWIYTYLCNQCLSSLMLRVQIPFRRGVLNTTLCDKVCQWRVAGRWFFPGTAVSSTNKTEGHNITEILLSGVKHHNTPTILKRSLSPKSTLLIRQDFKCTKIVKLYYLGETTVHDMDFQARRL